MNNDLIELNLPWVIPWFLDPFSEEIQLDDREKEVLDAITLRWPTTEKLTMFNSLADQYGRDVVGQVIDKVVAGHIQPEWEENGRKQQANGLNDFIRLMWEPLPSAGFAATFTHKPDGVQIHCTFCPLAETGLKNDAAFWMYHLVCSGDPYAASGFNPRIGFRRTQTLMEGHPCCDHFYFMKNSG
jgi:hypothetical protein